MILLIEYDRPTGSIISRREFSDADRADAERARLDLELDLGRKGIVREVVLLQATNEEAVRRTHRRYFETPQQLTT